MAGAVDDRACTTLEDAAVPPAPKLPALDPQTVPARRGSDYPAPFSEAVAGREKRRLAEALGLAQFGVNLVRLPPGCWSSQRHWHSCEDEFVYVLDGELTLVTDAGEQVVGPGMAAGFPAGRADGHHLVNRTDGPVRYLEVGTRREETDEVVYADIDMEVRQRDGRQTYVRKGGEPY
jgi:uncharacterized cupin superfamily protein